MPSRGCWISPVVEPVRQRLFFALWPTAELARQCEAVAKQHFDWRHARRLAAEQIHLTLVYLGPSDDDQRRCAEAVADNVQSTPFEMELDRLGVWPRPRVGWIAPREMPVPLPQLVAQLQQGLNACGYPPEERPFQAHITLLRKIRRPPEVEQLDSPLSWPVSEFVLVESRTLPQGAEYRILRQWPLV